MDTFFIFFFVFGIFVWCIWQLLSYTRNTIGGNSPLKVTRVYQISELAYFTKLDNLFSYSFLVLGLMFFKLIFTLRTAPDSANPWMGYLVAITFGFIFLTIGIFYLILDLNHWKYTEDVILTTHPELHELELTFSDITLRIKDGDIQRVVVIQNQAKIRFCYHTYFLQNGDHFILSDRMPGNWVIHEFFKKIPVEYHYKSFPYIS